MTPTVRGASTTLFSDGFESFDLWTQEGGDSKVTSSTTKYNGLQSAKFDNSDALSTSINTKGYENISFSYYYKTGTGYAGPFSVQYSVYGGTEWETLEVLTSARGSFTMKEYSLPSSANDLADLRIRFVSQNTGAMALYLDEVVVTGEAKATVPTDPHQSPEGPEMEIYSELFDDPDNFGSTGGVNVPLPWLQEGASGSAAKTSASSTAPSVPNMVKIDSKDSLALPLNLTGYGNIKLSYYTRVSSYTAGSLVVEWSSDGGAAWTTFEELKLPAGTASQPNTRKEWTLGAAANNNANVKIRFRVGEAMSANMYMDNVVISGQRIPGTTPAPTPVPMPEPVETPPFVPPAGVRMYEDVEIGMAGNRKLYTSIAVPETTPDAPMPVAVYIHGGGWNHGDRKQALSSISSYVLKRGYIGVSLDYRLTPEAPYPAQIQDVKLAIRYLRANSAQYHIDPSRIGVIGSSAGGHLAALLGTTSDLLSTEHIMLDNGNTVQVPDMEGTGGYPDYSTRVQAVVDWFGPADFTTEFANNYSSVTALLGGKKAFTVPNEARLAMPGTYASPDDPPIWIRHGKADLTVPYQNSEVLASQLTAAGVPVVDFKLVDGQGHGFVGEAKDIADAEAWAFLDQHVKNRTVTEPIIYKPGATNPNPEAPITVSLSPTTLSLEKGGTGTLTATVSGAGVDSPALSWTTSSSQIATVTSTGAAVAQVTGVSAGTAIIRASVSEQVYAEAPVTVTAPPPDPTKVVVTEIATLTPTGDAAIDSSSANAGTNFNEKTGSSVGLFSISAGSTNKKYVYFKYDVSAASDPSYHYKVYVSAKKGSSGTDVELSLYGLEDTTWSESTLTWNNAPVKSLNPSALLGKFTVNSSTTKLYEVDVTTYVRSRLGQGEVAFLLGDAASTGVSVNIYTKESTSSSNPKPKMVVQQILDYSNDVEAPAWPARGGLSAANVGTEFVDLSWPAATDNSNVSHYRIYRNGELMTTVQGTSYKVEGLSPGTTYTFAAEAVDVAGNRSAALSLTKATLLQPIQPLSVSNVTASGSDGNIEANAIDHNLYTRWSAAGAGQWIELDLGSVVPIGYAGISFYKGDLRSTELAIETSKDGLTWTPRYRGFSSGKSVQLQAFRLNTEARYVRVTGYGNSDGSQFVSLTEVQLYPPFADGDTPVAIVPTIEPGPPGDTTPFTRPGMKLADGTDRPVHPPHTTTGRTLNVLDFGADPGDNQSDDRPAIQAAIQAAQEGDEVFLPNGTYNLFSTTESGTNLVIKTGVNLRGESEAGTILKTSLNNVKNSTAIKSARQHDLVISHLTLTSTWDGVYSTDHRTNNPSVGGPDSQITIASFGDDPSYNITIDHVTVEKYSRMGVRIDNSRDVVVRSSTFRNATDVGGGGAGYGVSIQGMAKIDRLGYPNDTLWNVVENSSFEGPYLRHGVLIQFVAHNNVVRNNRFDQTRLDAIDLHGELEYLNDIYGNVITDVTTGGGIGLGNTGGTAPSNHSKTGHGNYIHDNIIRNSREGIIVILGTPDTLIERNVIENTTNVDGAAGIVVRNGPGTVIRENDIRNNTAKEYWGIVLEHDNGDTNAGNIGEGDPVNVQIVRNTIQGNTNGIYLKAGTNIVLRGNLLNNLVANYQAADGVMVRVEEASANADLGWLTVSGGTLTPAFAADVTDYVVKVEHTVSSLELSAAVSDPHAKLQINGSEVPTGIYRLTNLSIGETNITIRVFAESGATKTYTVNIHRAPAPNTDPSTDPGSGAGTDTDTNQDQDQDQAQDSGTVTGLAAAAPPIAGPVGQEKWAVKETASDGKRTVTLDIDEKGAERLLKEVSQGRLKLTLETAAMPDEASVSLSGAALRKLSAAERRMVLSVETKLGTYELPVQQKMLSEWASQVAAAPDDLQLIIKIMKNPEAVTQAVQEGQKVLGALDYTVTAMTADNRSSAISEFTQYVPRTMKLEREVNPNQLAVVRVKADSNGQLQYDPVPFTLQGATVTIFSRTNSTYMAMESQVSFQDIQLHWAKEPIERMANRRIIRGTSEALYLPDRAVTRAEFAAMMIRALGLPEADRASIEFRDVKPQDWYARTVNAAVKAGLIHGYEDQSFRPNEIITRQEMAVIGYRAMKTAGFETKAAKATNEAYDDASLMQDWAREAIGELVAQGILQGAAPGVFEPDGTATRAQGAVMLSRMLGVLFLQ
ncbi:S-layer homology domain-containing protein [Paenibacillus silviterrae]|uniref:S-layer homology domain-containing protein n=1 Tax=Paenibacillus silviterrae TaxID=3242194 RepID=UPI0025430C6C|nr:S-layer homology domain-containing protein [Paenibacillus chinjuensis]